MRTTFYDDNVFNEFLAWAVEDKKIFNKISALIKDIKRNPTDGIGKPEALKYEYSGYWSRRITDKHRLIYQVTENNEELIIISCKNHYAVK